MGEMTGYPVLPDEGLVDVGPTRLHVSVARPGEGHPLLLVNSFGATVDAWAPLRRRLPMETVAFDAPGTGRSPTPWWPPSMTSLAGMLDRLLDRVGHRRVDVLGYSFGGGLAQHLAHHYPDRVRKLVLVATSYGQGSVPGDVLESLSLLAALWTSRAAPIGGDGPAMGRAVHQPRPTLRGYSSQVVTAQTWAALPWLHRLQAETLVVAGTEDRVVPPINARILGWRIPRARLAMVEGAGHLLPFDAPGALAPLVTSFLAA